MIKLDLQLFGGRGAGSNIPQATPGGGGGGGDTGPMDQMPGAPKTLQEALGEKGRPMSTDDAVLGANPLHALGEEYQSNCQRSVVATEARFRGYDVMAQPTHDGDDMVRGNNYAKNFKNAKVESINKTTANARENEIKQKMKNYGNGSRALLSVEWKGKGTNGHVVNVVQRNGRTYVYDGQTGKQYSLNELVSASKSRNMNLVRVDNLEFSEQARKSVRPSVKRR